jgi:hypothetical protein
VEDQGGQLLFDTSRPAAARASSAGTGLLPQLSRRRTNIDSGRVKQRRLFRGVGVLLPPEFDEEGRQDAVEKPAPKAKVVPLQVRWPASDVKAAKLAAIQGDFPTVSDFMLTCFHVYMKEKKKP